MKYFVAALVATIAAAGKAPAVGDEEFHAKMEKKAIEGQKHVDQVVEDPYSLSGIYMNDHECMHAIGHDGTYHYVRMIPKADNKDVSNSSGDYIESTTMYNGKHLYVNFEKERFMAYSGDKWVITENSMMADVVHGRAKEPLQGLLFGEGSDKPESIEGFTISWENDMDLEPEWRCLMRPLLTQAVGYVEQAELSIESKMLLEEKKELVAVHERLVVEAEKRQEEASCIEIIEKAMAALEECELKVLRSYVTVADTYPQSWLTLLSEKVVCVDKFADATSSCTHLWTDQWGRYYG